MCISELLANGTPESVAAATLAQRLQEQLQQERENAEEANENEEMAPAKRGKHKAKKRCSKKRSNLNEDGSKRPRVANVLLENEMLIDEIRARKALWMRTHEHHHSGVLTAPLWEEIAKALDTTQENIRKRWKSLKDHYRRELKKSMTDATAPPSIWPYYKKMRFMKSQMFVSLRRKNGEDHLEILSDDEEDVNNQWNGHEIRGKQECGSDTMDDYELSEEYNEMVKYEQQMQQMNPDEMDGTQEEEEEEEEDQQQQDDEEQEGQMQEQGELSPAQSMQDQEEMSALQQQQAELSELSNMSGMQAQQQNVITANISTIAEMVGIPTIVTTTASSLSERLSDMQQHGDLQQQAPDMTDMNGDIGGMQQSGRISAMQQSRDINGDLAQQLNARHTVLQQRAEVNGRLSAIQRNAGITARQQRANIVAMHEHADMTAMQQRERSEMQRRNGMVDNDSNVSPITGDGGISDDYHFFMSLMPHVKNFTSLQKLKVRQRIQQIIIEEASNCQYDPLENC
ncbi:hypothetical protein TSAR_008507 [Trichomalopsis sarcophagae]|uniref:MADF domain-containing protein n=1 Tax=Trichomalopsis sarcophagae TaxID=543379 RepID=A0A232F135_9HYME|nr:hypothetical protein TSAR_008507 [Trichomalopsis sarcophagae]